MPHFSKSARAKPGSNPPTNPPPKAAPPSPQFTKSQQSSSDSGSSRPQNGPDSADDLFSKELSLEITEPFPPGLFRIPVPDAVFAEMPSLSDAALRCTLALIRLSFRYDPEEGSWVQAGTSFTRREIQEECGLSDEGTRQGLSNLGERGWAEVDRSGRSYRYQLTLEVPKRRYTYLPTTLLEKASAFASATALRVLLAVFRGTWGWARMETDPQSGDSHPVHRRWTSLSVSDLSRLTGHSETAIKDAVQDLGGEWIGRSRPSQGAYLYRVLPEAFGPQSIEEEPAEENNPEKPSSNTPTANTVTPHRQQSGPPTSCRENFSRDKHNPGRQKQRTASPPSAESKLEESGAVPEENTNQEASEQPAFEDFTDRKQSLARKLVNAGVWPERAKDCLRRYSVRRIEANFELFRRRAPEIEDHGAWLCAAITDGYVDLGSRDQGQDPGGDPEAPSLTPAKPDHKQKVSPKEKQDYLRSSPEVKERHFHRFRCGESPSEKQFLYLSPEEGGSPKESGPGRRAPTGKKPEEKRAWRGRA